jgi:L-seryl-tRNA(Ser) seleniumtransferase
VPDSEKLRALPSVHEVLESLPAAAAALPHALLVDEARRALDVARAGILAGKAEEKTSIVQAIAAALAALTRPSLRRVINATGVVVHTNLGRSPLGKFDPLPGYTNLEYEISSGRRGKRDTHTGALLERLLGAPAIVVNNNAAAVYLALHELAAGAEVIVSRGELIEIGDGFRIPEIMQRSGAVLREVGTTNKTHIGDYRDAINERTRLLLRVHPSNFRITGFTARPSLAELAALARQHSIPLYEDLGSGCLMDLRPFGIDEPLVRDSLQGGADLVSFSGDKLLGGPQAGVLAGRADLVARVRRNPMFRALRADKLIYQALETTLRNLLLECWDAIPALRMIRAGEPEIRARAANLLKHLDGIPAELAPGVSVIGGGATPEQSLPTCLIALRPGDVVAAERRLREADPPVIARIEEDRLLIDLRTVDPAEEAELAAILRTLLVP